MKSKRSGSLFEDDNSSRRKLTDAQIGEQIKPIAALVNRIIERLGKLEEPRLHDALRDLLHKHQIDFINLINLKELTSEKFSIIEEDILKIELEYFERIKESDRFILLEFDDNIATYKKLAVALNFNAHHAPEEFVTAENPALSLDSELDSVDMLLKEGKPALTEIQALLQDSEVREKLFEPTYARRFKKKPIQKIYRKHGARTH